MPCFVTAKDYFWTAHPQLEECSRILDATVVCYSDWTTIIDTRPIILHLPTAASKQNKDKSWRGTERGD